MISKKNWKQAILPVFIMTTICSFLFFLSRAAFDEWYGFSVCSNGGDWFNTVCNRYVFEYADKDLLIAFICAICCLFCLLTAGLLNFRNTK